MRWISFIFDWWNRATFGTFLFTWRKGEFVGQDQFGNRYYQERGRPDRKGPHWDRRKRWVIYAGLAEASTVPPAWNAWLQHNASEAPKAEAPRYAWEKSYVPNLTGTTAAYRPSGSLLQGGERPPATGDYEAWRPDA